MSERKRDRRFIERVSDRATDAYDAAAKRVIDAKERTQDVIKENPITSVIIAAAVGAAVGVITSELVHRSRRRE